MSWIAYKSNESNIHRDVREVVPWSSHGARLFQGLMGVVADLDLSLIAFISSQEQRYLGAMERIDHDGPRSTLYVHPSMSKSGCYVYTPENLAVFSASGDSPVFCITV